MARGKKGAAVAQRRKLKRIERPTAATIAPGVEVGSAVRVRTGGGTVTPGILVGTPGPAGRQQVVAAIDAGADPVLWEVPVRAQDEPLGADLEDLRAFAPSLVESPHILPRVGRLEVWADGSGVPDGPGGWGYVLRAIMPSGKVAQSEGSGGLEKATNNVAEITAIIEGLRSVKSTSWPITVISDSSYALGGFGEKWIEGWEARGWVNRQKEQVSNREVWEALAVQVERFRDIEWVHVKGHSKIALNERCDKLAGAARKKVIEQREQAAA